MYVNINLELNKKKDLNLIRSDAFIHSHLKSPLVYEPNLEKVNINYDLTPPLKPEQYHILDKEIRKLEKLYQGDMTLDEIAKQFNVGKTTLIQKIRELGWERKPRHKKKTVNANKIKEFIELGVSDKDIQKKLNIGRFVLSRYKKELGLYVEDEKKIFQGKQGAKNRDYYKAIGEMPECPFQTNILEKHKDEVIALLKKGTLRTEIAKKYHVSRSTVFNFMHLYGIKSPIIKVCDKNEQVILQNLQEGKSVEEIAQELHCSSNMIYRFLHQKGLKASQRKIVKKSFLNNQKNLIQKMYQQGLSGEEMAAKLNVSKASIYSCIKRFNLTRPKRWAEYRSTFKGHDKKLLQMRQRGMTLKQIGDIFGVQENTVSRRLKKLRSAYA